MHQRDQNSTSTHQFTSSSNSSKNISFWLRWLLFLSFPVLWQGIVPRNQQARLGTKNMFHIWTRQWPFLLEFMSQEVILAMYPPSPPWTAHISFNMTLILLWTTQLPVLGPIIQRCITFCNIYKEASFEGGQSRFGIYWCLKFSLVSSRPLLCQSLKKALFWDNFICCAQFPTGNEWPKYFSRSWCAIASF